MMQRFDVLVVGAGIAGASLAMSLAQTRAVALLEQESEPGRHSTGRSAALFSTTYGSGPIRALSRASRGFLSAPPSGFTDTMLVAPRGALHIGRADQQHSVEKFAKLADVRDQTRWLGAGETRALSPLLRDGYAATALHEPGAMDIEVAALHAGYLRGLRRAGGQLHLRQPVITLVHGGGVWTAHTPSDTFEAPILVNAAGAWADRIGTLAGAAPIGLTPRRRTAVLVQAPALPGLAASPLTIDIDHQFYFKPDAGLLLLSAADETETEPCDAQPEELDVAVAVDRVQQATTLEVRSVRSAWAGLRTFVADGNPVVGFDPAVDGLFWLAGQGGYGIQTAPALAQLATALIDGVGIPETLLIEGVDAADFNPARLRIDNRSV